MTQTHIHRTLPAALLVAVGLAAAAQAGAPTEQVRSTTDRLLSVVQNEALKQPGQEAERKRQVRGVVDGRFDWAAMARSAYGKRWRELDEPKRAEFSALFGDLIVKSYTAQVDNYSGEKIVYKGEKLDGNYGVVDVMIVTLRGTEIPLSYRVLKKGEEWKVYDVNIEGVSLVNNYRSQISAILDNATYDELIKKIKARIDAPSAKSDKGAGSAKAKEDAL